MNEQTISAEFSLDEPTFEQVFKEHYGALHAYANVILKDSAGAEEVVQTVFLKLWEKRSGLRITSSLKAYLYKAVYHYSLNHLKHQKVRQRHWEQTHYELNQQLSSDNSQIMEGQEKELMQRIQQILVELPEKCRMVFHLSRFEELKYGEIAEQLGISVKTVEAHMSKALKTLRLELAEFLPLLILFLQLLIKT
ncbi:RNA polymerase sigma-70 factor [Lunatibacter salilacus]|uniref:RNA polymerase sigma-70 factor n=1 Tax=Lunatibacter salilacus TaxID=2483804 RepID=UPI001F246EBE|nr:RNA polymerase sigma-70 factor [Lunatibacter salilacus]